MWRAPVLIAIFVLASFGGIARAQQTIHGTGGTDATNGLRITIDAQGAFQVYRLGVRQFFKNESVALGAGTTVNGPWIPGAVPWTVVSQSAVLGSGTIAAPYRVTTVFGNAAGFRVSHEIRYVVPDTFYDAEIVVTPPATNTASVRLYFLTDTLLSGGDTGAGFVRPTTGHSTVVGVSKVVGGATIYEALVEVGRPWDRWYSAYYATPYLQAEGGGDFTTAVSSDPSTDNGVSAEWIFGVITTPQTVRYRHVFATEVSAPVCGDGQATGFETCDDDDESGGDGCSAVCEGEDGWVCTGTPSVCTAICGDGRILGAEICDDADQSSGDGCSATCTQEPGWLCTGAPSTCVTTCGDGITAGSETCDDDGTAPGDGCDGACHVEAGYSCSGAPSTCVTTCGDGIVAGSERCDDGEVAPDDGCDGACAIELGFTCSGAPSTCATTCGDGIVAGAETCDDDATIAGDGCDVVCATEPGWLCSGAPSTCATSCGDGVIAGPEMCDDLNPRAGDGCDAACAIEVGFFCMAQPSLCVARCGDGIVTGGEECDDGDSAMGDGCDTRCAIEAGYACDGAPSTCVTSCGDGVIAGREACDDGDGDTGDGCDEACEVERNWSCDGEPSVCTERADAGARDASVRDVGVEDAALDAGSPPEEGDENCDCRAARGGKARHGALWFALGLVAFVRRRRQRAGAGVEGKASARRRDA